MTNPFSLQGKLILITGASSGIGRQCAISCTEAGAKVIALGRNEKELAITKDSCQSGTVSTISYDFNNIEGIPNLIDSIVVKFGKIDGLICSAGIEKTLPVKSLKIADFENLYRINTISPIELLKQCTIKDRYNEGMKIVFISSITSVVGRKAVSAYAASKGALVSACKSIALELSSKGININCISPGTILTPMMQKVLNGLPEEVKKQRISEFPLGIGEMKDVAYGCIYLLSDAARWITGINLIIDGDEDIQYVIDNFRQCI